MDALFDEDGEMLFEIAHCAVCGRKKGPSFLLWREDDGYHSNHAGWHAVDGRHYCPRCVGKLLGKAATA